MCMRSRTIMGHIAASNRLTITNFVVSQGITLQKVSHSSLAKIRDSQQVVEVIRLA
jgi:hypothetical protein